MNISYTTIIQQYPYLPSPSSPSLLLFPPLPSQFSLLSEVRGLVTPQDLERFDGLVLRREIQALKARQGPAGAPGLHQDSQSMVSYPDTLTSSSASFMTNTTLSSARVRPLKCIIYCMYCDVLFTVQSQRAAWLKNVPPYPKAPKGDNHVNILAYCSLDYSEKFPLILLNT